MRKNFAIAFMDLKEWSDFNVTVWNMLTAIIRLMDLAPTTDSTEPFPEIRFSFLGNGKQRYRGVVSFISLGRLVHLKPSFDYNILFDIPKGCNVQQCFGLLLTEVSKLAFAMTQGRVGPADLDEALCSLLHLSNDEIRNKGIDIDFCLLDPGVNF